MAETKQLTRPKYGRVSPVSKARSVTQTRRVYTRPRSGVQQFKGRLKTLEGRKDVQTLKKAESIVKSGYFKDVKSLAEYEQKYEALPKDVQGKILSPQEMKTTKQGQATEVITKIDESISKNLEKIQYETEKLERRKKALDKKWDKNKEDYRKGRISKERYLKNKERYKRYERELENSYSEKVEYLKEYNKTLEAEKQKIGVDYTPEFKDVRSLAYEKAGEKKQTVKERLKRSQEKYTRGLLIERLTGLGYHKQTMITPIDEGKAEYKKSYYDPTTGKSVMIGTTVGEYQRYRPVYQTVDDKGEVVYTIDKSKVKRPKVTPKREEVGLLGEVKQYEIMDLANKKIQKVYLDVVTGKIVVGEDKKVLDEVEAGEVTENEAEKRKREETKNFLRSILGEDYDTVEGGKKVEEKKKIKIPESFAKTAGIIAYPQLKFIENFKTAQEGFNKALDKVGEYVHFTPSKKFPFTLGKLEEKTVPEKVRDITSERIKGEKEQVLFETLGSDYEKFDKALLEDLQAKYQPKTQEMFDVKYKSKIEEGKITFSEAKKEFEQSEEYKQLMKKYNEEYKTLSEKGYKKFLKETPLTQQIRGAGKYLWLSAQEGMVKALATPMSTAKTAATFYLAPKLYRSLPTWIQIGAETASLGYGGSLLTSKTTTIPQKATGLVLVGTSSIALGARGIKLARKPDVEFKVRKNPRMRLKAHQAVFVEDVEKGIIKYPEQKMLQYGVPGRRTEVTTNWRSWVNRLYRTVGGRKDLVKKLYYGSPLDRKGYKRAFKLLRSYGVSETRTRSLLRQIKPQEYDVKLEGVLKIAEGDKAVGVFKTSREKVKLYAGDIMAGKKKYPVYTAGGGGKEEELMLIRRGPLKGQDRVIYEIKDVFKFKSGEFKGYKKYLDFVGAVEKQGTLYRDLGILKYNGKEALLTEKMGGRFLTGKGYELRMLDIKRLTGGRYKYLQTGLEKGTTRAVGIGEENIRFMDEFKNYEKLFKTARGTYLKDYQNRKYGGMKDVDEVVKRIMSGEKVKVGKTVDLFEDTEAFYLPKQNKIYLNLRKLSNVAKYKKNLLFHEATHATYKNVGGKITDDIVKNARKEYIKLGGDKWDIDSLEYRYSKAEVPEDTLATFAEKYPTEVVHPTTKTGEILNKQFAKMGFVEQDQGFRDIQSILRNNKFESFKSFITKGGGGGSTITVGKEGLMAPPKVGFDKISNVGLTSLAVGAGQQSIVVGAVGALLASKVDQGFKPRLKSISAQDVYSVSEVKTAQKFDSVLKSGTAQKSAVVTQPVSAKQPTVIVETPIPKTPTPKLPRYNIGIRPRMIKEELKGKKKGKTEKKKKKKKYYAYIPDFTSRAVGLEAIEVSEKEAERLTKQIMTGAEIRSPVRVVK